MVNIYVLIDPRTDEIRYVGKTVKPIHQRLRDHYHSREFKANTRKNNWLRQLQKQGLKPEIRLAAICGENEWEKVEQEFISLFDNLTNATPGGDGVKKFTKEIRDKISKANSKSVFQYTLNGRFIKAWQSVKTAAESLGLSKVTISAAASLNNRKKSAGGFIWSYTKAAKLPAYYDRSHSKVEVIFPNGTIKVFDTIVKAAEATGLNKGTLSWLLQEGITTFKSFKFKRA